MNLENLLDYDEIMVATATPIYLIADAVSELAHIPEQLRDLAARNNFQSDGGCLVGEAGVLLGVGDGGDPFALAAAAEKLGKGVYRVDGSVDEKALLGWLLGGYRFDRYRKPKAFEAQLVAPEGIEAAPIREQAKSVALARDLVNTPASDMLPDALEQASLNVAAAHGATLSVIVGDELLTENFPMIHAVGRASSVAPRLLDMTWGRPDAPKVTLVGKGVCFDSGGLNVKGASGMAIMKKDMGGAANALALANLIMAANLDVSLRVLIPAVENAIAGNAFRPGDVLTSRSGLTVEIGNTDAEGRLVLADAMTYGGEDAPDLMISLATLTGAARVALGPELPPFYTQDEALAAAIQAACVDVFDPAWRMPLWAPYAQMLASPIADLNNISGGGFAGSITAALFLQRFAPQKGSWAHFDIYAWRPKSAPGRPHGGEAQAIRALFHVLTKKYGRIADCG